MELFMIILIILILILLFVVFDNYYILTYTTDLVEPYDMEISDITSVDCGNRCTVGINCSGFAYNIPESKCYLSKSSILGKPIESLYSDSYSKLDRRCNKINRITDSTKIDGNTLTQNSIYVCSDGEIGTMTEFQYANLGATALSKNSVLFDRVDSDFDIPEKVSYKTYQIEWPKTKPTEIDKIKPFFGQDAQPNSKKEDIIKSDDNKNEKYGFIESDKEYLGQYVLAHQCVVNVPQYDCLNFCKQTDSCVGTEWNKALIRNAGDNKNEVYVYEDVCCPKTVIKQIIPRRDKMNRGKFFVKTNLDKIPKDNNIVMSRSRDIKSQYEPVNFIENEQ